MSRGTIALVLGLFVVTLLMILAGATIFVIANQGVFDGDQAPGFGEAADLLWEKVDGKVWVQS